MLFDTNFPIMFQFAIFQLTLKHYSQDIMVNLFRISHLQYVDDTGILEKVLTARDKVRFINEISNQYDFHIDI